LSFDFWCKDNKKPKTDKTIEGFYLRAAILTDCIFISALQTVKQEKKLKIA